MKKIGMEKFGKAASAFSKFVCETNCKCHVIAFRTLRLINNLKYEEHSGKC